MNRRLKDFPGQAFLELLRPPKLATTRFAFFASYSADPIVLGGALLHLHARGRDSGGGNKSDFASALEALRDKVRFVVQRGRIHRGHKLPKIAAILDQLVVEMDYHERVSSWHPKIALVCYEQGTRHFWRLWIGSRNLTMSRDLDLGLILDGEAKRRKGSQNIAGIDALGADLARLAKLPGAEPDALARELQSVRWMAPEGIDVGSVELWLPGARPAPAFDSEDKRKLVVLSPFLSDAFVASLARTTTNSRDRTLVTTLPALRKLNPASKASLADFRLLSLTAPNPEGETDQTGLPSADATQDDQEGENGRAAEHTGLHAKLYAAIRGTRVDIVAGSANATGRAWSARNAEAVARFSGGQTEIDGIMAIVGSATPIPPLILETLSETAFDVAEARLEQVRWAIAELPLALRREAKAFTLLCDTPFSLPATARLEVGLATMPLCPWPPGARTIPLGDISLSLQTDLVQFRLSIGDAPSACWLQRVPVTPNIDPDRDSAAISRFLSVAGLQTWLREMLDTDGNAGSEDDWDADEDGEVSEAPAKRQSWQHDGFALEDMLAAWARNDHEKLRRVDNMLDRYVAAVLRHGEHLSDRDRGELASLRETWAIARDVLVTRA